MTRHSKNATSAAFYSYHERQKIRETQQKRMKKERKEWEAQEFLRKQRMEAHATEVSCEQIRKFHEAAEIKVLPHERGNGKKYNGPTNIKPKLPESLPKAVAREQSFWIRENTPSASSTKITEPQKRLECPILKEPLRLKKLVHVKPETLTDDTESTRWVCSISKRQISCQNAAVVKQTGQVVLLEYLKKYILGKKGALIPNKTIDKEDIVVLRSGGTGFSSHNKVEAKLQQPNIQ